VSRWRWLGAIVLFVPLLGLVAPPYTGPADPRADAALVLSGDVDYLRLRHAVDLYRRGSIRAVVLTGAGVGGDSATTMAEVARREMAMPAAAIFVEARSRSTRENLAGAAPLLREHGYRRVALVTSASHMGRALRVARKRVPDVEWVPAAVRDAGPWARVYRVRLAEWVKLLGYALRGWV
jgi:uncharacterized SAM-binding protein YcdF (DUF218 family)